MRDPHRIDDLLEALRKAWERNPDLRLGQLIHSAASTTESVPPCPALFHLEDDRMLAALERFLH